MSGAWVNRATLQAAEGAPMPTKHTSSFDSARAAAIVIISSGVKSGMPQLLHPLGEHLGADVEHVGAHPGIEGAPVGGDLVPVEIAPVVAGVIAMSVGGVGAAGHYRDGAHRKARQHAGIGMHAVEIVDDFLDGD